MSKVITTKHPEIGYADNVAIVEQALRDHFGIQDNSSVQTAVAARIWAEICGQGLHNLDGSKHWGTAEILRALESIQYRVNHMHEFVTGEKSATVLPEPEGIAVKHSATPEGWEYIEFPITGWDDVKPYAKRVLLFGGKHFTFSCWNSDRLVCIFRHVPGSPTSSVATVA